MRPPYSSGVQRLLKQAQHIAGRYNHRFVHTEYLLLALLKENNGATELLRGMRQDINALRRKCEHKCKRGEHPMEEPLKLTPSVQNVFAIAHEQVRELNHKTVDTRHILLGLILEDEGPGGEVLRHEGITAETVRAAIAAAGQNSVPKSETASVERPTLWKRLIGGK